MNFKATFQSSDPFLFGATFQGENPLFNAEFKNLQLVHTEEIPKEYGLITYTQDRIITVS